MRRLALDASVAIKWVVQEIYTEAAVRLAESGPSWVIPDLFYAEVGNVLWKKVRRGEMNERHALNALDLLLSAEMNVRESHVLLPYALPIALHFHCTIYDALYLSVAVDENCPLVTADKRLFLAFSQTPLGEHLVWVEEAPLG
jgi:predicted nucleic acid-binding protein